MIERLPEDPQLFELRSLSEKNLDLEPKEKELFDRLTVLSYSVDCKESLRYEWDYYGLPEERTTLDADARQVCYRICLEYQKWLEQSKLYDDNDLIREVLKSKQDLEKYDIVVVDEVQDYTELQLYFIKQLVNDPGGLIFLGDVHQIINPTIFDGSRLHSLVGNQKLNEQTVSKNYRSTKQIVSLTNSLAKARAKYIAKKSGEIPEVSFIEGCNPISLRYTKDNLFQLLHALMDYPRTAVLVADECEKSTLISIIGEETYKKHDMDFIFTIPEIKGMEYRYVVCFNLISYFQNNWKIVLQGQTRKKTSYRYYFNLLYVAISRSQEYLCIIENDAVTNIRDQLLGPIEQIDDYDRSRLYIDLLPRDIDEIIAEAKDYYAAGEYRLAKQRYERAGKTEYAKDIAMCDIQLNIKEKQYEKALRKALIVDDEETIKNYISEIPKRKNLYTLLEAYLDISKYSGNRKLPHKDISLLVKQELPYLTPEEKEDLEIRFIKRCDDHIMTLLDQGIKKGVY